MKNKSLILSIVFWFVTTALMAVSLPSTSYYRGATMSAETFQTQVSTGVSINGYSLVGAADYENTSACTTEGVKGDPTECQKCCDKSVLTPCEDSGEDFYYCGGLNTACIESCTAGTSLPLDAPTAFLLALVAAYGAVAVYRKRIQQA